MLARPGQLPVRAQEQRVGPWAARQVQHDGTIAPVQARAPPSAASVIAVVVSPNLPFFFYGASFFSWAAHSPRVYLPVKAGENSFFTRFCAEKMRLLQPVYLYTGRSNSSFCTILHGMT